MVLSDRSAEIFKKKVKIMKKTRLDCPIQSNPLQPPPPSQNTAAIEASYFLLENCKG
jgi:hypothetical protein